jgi:hypothetical protein
MNKEMFLSVVLAITAALFSGLAIMSTISPQHISVNKQPPAQQSAPVSQPIASVPSPSTNPAPSQVDFEDMAGLDVATQNLLNERYQGQGPGDFEKRLRKLEREMAAVLDRVFGRSLRPGEGQIGELGESSATDK